MINPELLKILVCPIGRADVRLEGDFLVCTQCGTRYPIVDDIPIMLVEEATLPEGITQPGDVVCRPDPAK